MIMKWEPQLTPESLRSAQLAPPPWRYAGEIIAADFRVDPERLAGLLPEALTPHPTGRGTVIFAEWGSTAESDPRTTADHTIGQYREAVVLLHAEWRSSTILWAPHICIDSNLPITRGLIQGHGIASGRIAMSRAHELGAASPRKRPGGRFVAHAVEPGLRRVSISVDLSGEDEGSPHYLPVLPLNLREWPGVLPGRTSAIGVPEAIYTDLELGPVHVGPSGIDFDHRDGDPLSKLGPIIFDRGYVHSLSFSIPNYSA